MRLAEVPFGAMLPWRLSVQEHAAVRSHDVGSSSPDAGGPWRYVDGRRRPDDGLALLECSVPAEPLRPRSPHLVVAAWSDRRGDVTVEAGVDVGCRCPQDHGVHRAGEATWHPASAEQFVEAWRSAYQHVQSLLNNGFDDEAWLREAGLPAAREYVS